MYNKLKECVESIKKITDFEPEIAIVLGSGLGEFANGINAVATVNYSDINGFPVSTVSGHEGRFVFGYVGDKRVVAMQGRVHYYEGYSMDKVVMPIRIMGMLGAKKLILTNAAGGVNANFKVGDLMLITDHISSFVPSALIGKNIDQLGDRFPDMSNVYCKQLQNVVKDSAQKCKIDLKQGVYVQLTGPNYETPAEIKMVKTLGADAVGMSTACEAMAAVHMGLTVCGISCITNMAAGISETKLSHDEVKQTTDRVADSFKALISDIIKNI